MRLVRRFHKILAWPTRVWRQQRVERAAKLRRPFVANFRQIQSRLWIEPDLAIARLYVKGRYEPGLVKYLERSVHPGMVCADVGANVGFFTLLFGRLVGASGQVFAFEPTPRTFQSLKKNIDLNNLVNVVAYRTAISDHSGNLSFQIGSAGYDVYNAAALVQHPAAAHAAFTTIVVPCTTLDRIFENNRVNVIKVDVEGAELHVLNGVRQTLALNPKLRVILELSGVTLKAFGYKPTAIVQWLYETKMVVQVITNSGSTRVLTPSDLEQASSGMVTIVATQAQNSKKRLG